MNLCSICNRKFATCDLLQSSQDDYFCKECFKCEYCTTRQTSGSSKKKAIAGNKCEGDSVTKAKKMFPLAELLTIRNDRERKQGLFTSKRPLQCPHGDCNKYVSVVDLNAHFQHEHMEVRIVQTSLGKRNQLTFFPKDIRYGVNQCLILLNIVSPTETIGDEAASQAERVEKAPITVAVLASRLASAQLGRDNSTEDCFLDEEEQTGLMLSSDDKIIIWTASNVITPYPYTVAVSTVTEHIRVKFYGPLLQIGHSAKELCLEGRCLTLSHFHFLGMSDNGMKPLHLDVIVHSDDA